jgi:hypothetical protein
MPQNQRGLQPLRDAPVPSVSIFEPAPRTLITFALAAGKQRFFLAVRNNQKVHFKAPQFEGKQNNPIALSQQHRFFLSLKNAHS